MLQWNSMHPYNAVHLVRISGTLDSERLKTSINRTLGARGLTGLHLNHDHTYCYRGGVARCEIINLDAAGSPRASLSTEIERQLNTPFLQAQPFSPFRFFILSGNDSFSLGLVYLHAVADAESIVILVKEIIEHYFGKTEPGPRTAFEVRPPEGHLLFSHPGVLAWKLAALPSLIGDLRTSCRPSYRDATDLNNGFTLCPLEPRGLRCLVDAAKSWGITLNDVLLALLMKSCTVLATGRARAARRKKISIGCIVNTRRELKADHQGAFGLCLGSFIITHAVPEELRLMDVAKAIARRTSEIKRKRLYLATSLELSFGRFVFSFFSTERQKKLYQKHYPLWGGLTNMNINSLWQPQEKEMPMDYIRAVSTGPVTPLVLSFTTAGKSANVALSYRSTVFSAADIERLESCFLGAVADLEARG
jgi:NRPS condensation-like uncharacterized protein